MVFGLEDVAGTDIGNLVLPVLASLPRADFSMEAHVSLQSDGGTASLYPWPAMGTVHAWETPVLLHYPPVLEPGEVYHETRSFTNGTARLVPEDELTWHSSYPSDEQMTPLKMVSAPPPDEGPLPDATTRLEIRYC